jgi:hypothetical protein
MKDEKWREPSIFFHIVIRVNIVKGAKQPLLEIPNGQDHTRSKAKDHEEPDGDDH